MAEFSGIRPGKLKLKGVAEKPIKKKEKQEEKPRRNSDRDR